MNRRPVDEAEEVREEDGYVNEAVRPVEEVAAPPEPRSLSFTSLPPAAVCCLMLVLVAGLRIHFTSVMFEHHAQLTAENQNLKNQNQELENQRNNLTEEIQNLQATWNELNISRAQWSVEAYCRVDGDGGRRCDACQKGWEHTAPRCHEVHNASSEQKTWKEARENCRGKNSDLADSHTQNDHVISGYSRGPPEGSGYWIGLRVEDGRWRWMDGTDSSWREAPTEGHCAASVSGQPWRSVRCDDKQRWICVQEALSV